MLGDVATRVEAQAKGRGQPELGARCFYVLPGLNELEAVQALNERLAGPSQARWTYGHPYEQSDIPSPCAKIGDASSWNLGQIIPSFDDDPKSRFMVEIAHTTQVDGLWSPSKKRRKLSEAEDGPGEGDNGEGNGDEKDVRKRKELNAPPGELSKVSADEFWERMSFRQECVAGKVTGFFVLVFPASSTAANNSTSSINSLAPQPGEVSHHVVHRVVDSLMKNHEFSTRERSIRATSLLESVMKGFCSGALPHRTNPSEASAQAPNGHPIPEAFLLEGNPDASAAHQHSATEENGHAVADERARTPPPGPIAHLAVPHTPPRRPSATIDADITPNPFPEPEASEGTYLDYVYGSVSITNPEFVIVAKGTEGRKEAVTVLAVRKKKR